MPPTTIIVPCYNEESRLDVRSFAEFARSEPGIDFLFVDDGSRDRTFEVLSDLALRDARRFGVLRLQRNSGKAEAVRRGLLRALEAGPSYVGFWDADLATPLAAIPAFRRVLDERPDVELVLGSRLRLLGHDVERTRLRYWLGRRFATAASVVLGLGVHDTQCGAKLFRATPLLSYLLAEPFLARWTFDVEILARWTALRRCADQRPLAEVLYELPLDVWREIGGSKVRSRDFAVALGDLARIYWRYLRAGADWPPNRDNGLRQTTVPLATDEDRQQAA